MWKVEDGRSADNGLIIGRLSIWRAALILFIAGALVGTATHQLHQAHGITVFTEREDAVLLLVCCGFSTSFIGTMFPLINRYIPDFKPARARVRRLGEDRSLKVLRSFICFLGINYATAKLPFQHNTELFFAMAIMSILLWYIGDGTRLGFMLSLLVSCVGTLVAQFIVLRNTFRFTAYDLFLVPSWLPCVLFAAGITFGNLGRFLIEERT